MNRTAGDFHELARTRTRQEYSPIQTEHRASSIKYIFFFYECTCNGAFLYDILGKMVGAPKQRIHFGFTARCSELKLAAKHEGKTILLNHNLCLCNLSNKQFTGTNS